MRGRGRRAALAMWALGLLLLVPGRAWAWPTLSSSMGVECITNGGVTCSALKFGLQVDGDHRLSFLQIVHQIPSVFSFDRVLSVVDAFGNTLAWSSGRWTDTDLAIQFFDAAGYPASEPLYATVALAGNSAGTAADLDNEKFDYYAKGYTGQTGYDVFQSTGATATPEPASMILLGSGLFGVGMARRKKKKLEEAAAV